MKKLVLMTSALNNDGISELINHIEGLEVDTKRKLSSLQRKTTFSMGLSTTIQPFSQ